MFLFDSHAHLNMPQFRDSLDEVIDRAKNIGVKYIINVGFDRKSSEESIALSEKYDFIYAIIGFHPHDAKDIEENDFLWLEKNIHHEKVVAIGEIGLDFHYDNSPREIQKEVFTRQMELAKKNDFPVVIHSRDAAKQTGDILFSYNLKTLLHCYSGSLEMAREYVKKDYFIALGGAVTFKNAKRPKQVAAGISLDNLLIETDSPYMAPVPYRGKTNEPSFIIKVAEEIASIRKISVEKVGLKTFENACKFFNLGALNG